MKKSLAILTGAIVLGVCVWLWLPFSRDQSNPEAHVETSIKSQMKKQLSQLKPMEPWSGECPSPSASIPADMRGATSDPAVVELMRTYRKTDIGRVVTTDRGRQQLWIGQRLIFEAKRIGSRNQAKDGTMAVEAVTGTQTPIEEAEVSKENGVMKLVSSPREVWLISSTGKKTKVSPPNVDSFSPVIAPNGKIMAFTGRPLDEKGFPSIQRIYVGNPANGQYRTFGTEEHLDNYQVSPIDWIESDSILRVLQDYGETGGHMKLMIIRGE